MTVSFNLRDLDNSANDSVQQPIAVQYRLSDSGAWANVPNGYVADASAPQSAPAW